MEFSTRYSQIQWVHNANKRKAIALTRVFILSILQDANRYKKVQLHRAKRVMDAAQNVEYLYWNKHPNDVKTLLISFNEFLPIRFVHLVALFCVCVCGGEGEGVIVSSHIYFPTAFVVYLDGTTFPRYSLWYCSHCHSTHFKFALLHAMRALLLHSRSSGSLIFHFSSFSFLSQSLYKTKCKHEGQYSIS